jgi:VanZ family protein
MASAAKQRWIVCCVYAVFLLVISVLPARFFGDSPDIFPGQDKLVHAAVYAGFAFLLARATAQREALRIINRFSMAASAAAGYGALMELLQLIFFWSQRSFSWGDILANLAGAALGAAFFFSTSLFNR